MPKNEDLYMTDALRRWREKTDVPFLIVAIASIPFLLLELVSHRLAGSDKALLLIVNVVVLAVFAVAADAAEPAGDSAFSTRQSARRRSMCLWKWCRESSREGRSRRALHARCWILPPGG